MTTLWERHHYAKCFGNWAASDQDCIKCAVSGKCERKTKRSADTSLSSVEDVSPSGSLPADISPLDYMIQRLSGMFSMTVEDKAGAKIYRFTQNEKTVVGIVVGVSGKIKIVSSLKGRQVVFDSIPSISDAERILSEIV